MKTFPVSITRLMELLLFLVKVEHRLSPSEAVQLSEILERMCSEMSERIVGE